MAACLILSRRGLIKGSDRCSSSDCMGGIADAAALAMAASLALEAAVGMT